MHGRSIAYIRTLRAGGRQMNSCSQKKSFRDANYVGAQPDQVTNKPAMPGFTSVNL